MFNGAAWYDTQNRTSTDHNCSYPLLWRVSNTALCPKIALIWPTTSFFQHLSQFYAYSYTRLGGLSALYKANHKLQSLSVSTKISAISP